MSKTPVGAWQFNRALGMNGCWERIAIGKRVATVSVSDFWWGTNGNRGASSSAEESKAAADAQLRADGWILEE